MLEVCVGERPKPISRGPFEDFNAVFLAMFDHFQEHERIVTVWLENHPEDPLGRFGSMTVANVRRWLEYYQLIIVSKAVETMENKRKNLTIICPTKRGKLAYEEGLLITVDYFSERCEIGIGKPYPKSAGSLHEVAYNIWHRKKIAMSRQEKWNFELREYCVGLLNKENHEAVQQVGAWAEAKAWDWNINHKRRRSTIKTSPEEGLPTTQRRLFGIW